MDCANCGHADTCHDTVRLLPSIIWGECFASTDTYECNCKEFKMATDETTTHECFCGCTGEVAGKRSRFAQGHDQRLVGLLSKEVVEGRLTEQKHLISLLKLDKTYKEKLDIQDRINIVVRAVEKFVSGALANKTQEAMMRRWEKSGKGKPTD